ncbi:MAG: hypothetical protein H0U45_07425 [Tatlockia sp.]|nr:hypothetical protein [Tatlockia sp.]
MPKPPRAMGAETQTKNLNRIVLRNSASLQYTAPIKSPALPPHLDKLLDEAWTSDASRQIDLWLWYVQQEFETVGGEY